MLEESDYQVLDHSLKALTSLASISNIIQSADISAVMQLMSRLGSVSEAAKTVNIFLAEVTSKGIVNASQLIDNIEDIMEKQVKAKMAAQRFSAVREVSYSYKCLIEYLTVLLACNCISECKKRHHLSSGNIGVHCGTMPSVYTKCQR